VDARAPLDIDALHHALDERWARVQVVEATESTNADLLADHRAPDRAVLVAEHQVAGRGRLNRTWETPPRAGLTFSVLIRPDVPMVHWGWLPLLTGVAAYEAVRAEAARGRADVRAGLKWPNDLLLAPAHAGTFGKAAGILAQSHEDTVVLGVGLNVSTTRAELPVESATSLAECGVDADRTTLLIAILTRLDARLAQWSDVNGEAEACGLGAAYGQASLTIGQQVTVTGSDGTTLTGMAVGVDAEGRLLVDCGATVRVVSVGDVEHVRPSSAE
jgi:BirA family transcriptional regulator, biotin operon repressor / biotin---[acetyl-CoA-carboxylase] ligase